jgi:pterin-4a-carbinolamine dehydratase
MMEKFKFKVVINNAGEILTFYTVATSEGTAKRNALSQLAKKLGHHPASTITRLWDRATVALAGV